jgi:16S rRNA (adenine1518-N6/adenine1519-N6)-dimethyltransferase
MNISETRDLLNKYEISPTRSLGQNFLIDDRVVQLICMGADVSTNDNVLEIGPGLGSLTRALSNHAGFVKAIEIDKKMVAVLKDTLFNRENIEIIHEDALKVNFSELFGENSRKIKVAANLPYYITTPLVEKLIIDMAQADVMMLMMQREAAERLIAVPKTKLYGPVSVLTALYGHVEKYVKVPAAAYIPRPNVESLVLRLVRWDNPNSKFHRFNLTERKQFKKFLDLCFSQRRKKLLNVLRGSEYDKIISDGSLTAFLSVSRPDGNVRAEELSPDMLLEIFCMLNSAYEE